MNKSRLLGAVCACLTIVSINANAMVIAASDLGWYMQNGNHDPLNQNALTGLSSISNVHRSYFLFDLSSLNGLAISATLQLELDAYYSDDAFESATLWDVSSPHRPLLDTTDGSGSGTNIYADIGSGTAYGSFTFQTPNLSQNYPYSLFGTPPIININLNSSAIADINASSGGLFAIGVSLDELSLQVPLPSGGVEQEWLRFENDSGLRTYSLTINTVPIPPALYLFGSGLLGLIGVARKKNNG